MLMLACVGMYVHARVEFAARSATAVLPVDQWFESRGFVCVYVGTLLRIPVYLPMPVLIPSLMNIFAGRTDEDCKRQSFVLCHPPHYTPVRVFVDVYV